MELYVLDDLLRRVQVVDSFKSLIWTERFSAAGDFQLVIRSTRETRGLLTVDTKVGCNRSYRVMTIDTVEDKAADDGTQFLTVSGTSLEIMLKDRVAKDALQPMTNISKGTATMTIASPGVVTRNAHGLVTGDTVYFTTTGALPSGVTVGIQYFVIYVSANTFRLATSFENAMGDTAIDTSGSQSGTHTLWWVSTGKWKLNGSPADIAREIFQVVCVDGDLDAGDVIPFYTPGTIYPADTIPEPEVEVEVLVNLTSVYDAIKDLCDPFNLGFRLVRNFDESELYFDIYSGSDRTTLQDDLAPVVFSPELDNLADISELTSTANYKNVAYVFSPNGVEIVYAEGADSSTSGFDRRVLYVDASDIEEPAGATLTELLRQRGREELARNKQLLAFDGEIPQFGSYKYEIDYWLGDLVEIRNSDGVANNMRVTEQIFVHDESGERSYPTLAIDILITPGSWYAWEAGQTWDEIPDDSDHEWEDY